MAEERMIGSPVKKSEFHQVRVTVKDWEGREYVHLRVWLRPKPKEGEEGSASDSDYKPTKSGVCVTTAQALELCNNFDQLRKELEKTD